ncbi:MAG: hypothetical protein HGN29_12560 [Asgard group archaeon]|nr:hypothetical protein [Asgard group archaeon]
MNVKETFSQVLSFLDKRASYMGFIFCFVFALIFVFTPLWQLSILASFIGGLFYKKMNKGALIGSVGVALAWAIYIVIEISSTNVSTLFDQVGGIIIGLTGFGWIFILVLILLGAIFGSLGGSFGSGIRILFEIKQGKTSE